MHSDEEVVAWYEDVEDEAGRLDRTPHSRLEDLRTRELISRHLPEPPVDPIDVLDVLDVGGGTGPYAAWLAALGHSVHVVDPVPRHVESAGRHAGVTAAPGDARALREPDDSQDLVLLLGPLYHLANPDERHAAWREALRVTRRGGRVFAAAIGRYSVIGEFALAGGLTEDYQEILGHLVRTGENLDIGGFPLGHAHTAGELATEAVDAGWTQVQVFGLEGPMAYGFDLVAPDGLDAVLPQAVAAARMVEQDARAINLSPHLLLTAVRA